MSLKLKTSPLARAEVQDSKILDSPAASIPVSATSQSYRSSQGWRLLIVLSVVFHGGLLVLPMPQGWLGPNQPVADIPEDSLEESGAIALTTLPIIAEPDSTDLMEPTVLPIVPPQSRQPELPAVPETFPVVEAEEESVLEETDEPLEQDVEPQAEEESLPHVDNNEPEAGIAIAFSDDFPHIVGAQSGCYGLNNCLSVSGQNFRDIAKEVRQRLENQGYELTIYDNGDTSGGNHRIYEMRLLNQTEVKYLNIFGEGLTGAFYIITPDLITKEDLEDLELNG